MSEEMKIGGPVFKMLTRQLKVMRDALRFYAEEENWVSNGRDHPSRYVDGKYQLPKICSKLITDDAGAKAREAFEEIRRIEQPSTAIPTSEDEGGD